MARTRIIYSPTTGKKMAEFRNGELVWASDEFSAGSDANAPMVMNDIQPYQSMIDGSMITSRSQHRAHLKAHKCIEVGNETKYLQAQNKPLAPPPGLKQTLIEVANAKLRYK
jgi:hypothetical protein